MDAVADSGAQTVADSAQDDLDTLLNEYDEGTTTAQPAATNDLSKVTAYVERKEREEIAAQTEKDISGAVGVLKGSVDSLPERLLRGAIHDKAAEDDRFLNAYENRHKNPQGWNKVLGALGEELKAELMPVDQKATDDSNALIAAMSGSETKQPEPDTPPDYQRMSDTDFQKSLSEINWG